MVWTLLARIGWLDMGNHLKPAHLLWALMWPKMHAPKAVHVGQAGCYEKTFHEKVWFFLKGIALPDKHMASVVQKKCPNFIPWTFPLAKVFHAVLFSKIK